MHFDWQFLENTVWNFFAGHMGELVSGFGGALMGAVAAYQFERHKESAKQAEDMRSAIRFAQLTLICHVNWLLGAQKFLETYRKTEAREAKIPHFLHRPNHTTLDVRALSFVLDHDANLLLTLHTADASFQSAADTLTARNLQLTELQSGARVQNFDIQTGAATVNVSLPQLKILRDLTDALYDAVDGAIADNSAAILKLKDFGKHLFPKHKFLSFAPDEKQPSKLETGA